MTLGIGLSKTDFKFVLTTLNQTQKETMLEQLKSYKKILNNNSNKYVKGKKLCK